MSSNLTLESLQWSYANFTLNNNKHSELGVALRIGIAQLVVYLLWEQDVTGSSPVAYTNISVRKLAKRLHLGCSDLFVSLTLT